MENWWVFCHLALEVKKSANGGWEKLNQIPKNMVKIISDVLLHEFPTKWLIPLCGVRRYALPCWEAARFPTCLVRLYLYFKYKQSFLYLWIACLILNTSLHSTSFKVNLWFGEKCLHFTQTYFPTWIFASAQTASYTSPELFTTKFLLLDTTPP